MAGYATPAWSNDQSPAIDDSALLDIGHGIEIAEHPYGVCSTAAATAAKEVTIDYSGTLTLFTGLTVRVKFSNANTAANPTLNVNSTGAAPIVYYGTTAVTAQNTWTAGVTVTFSYDGTNWVMDALPESVGLLNEGIQLYAGSDLDNVTQTGWYYWNSTPPTHSPDSTSYCAVCVDHNGTNVRQTVYRGTYGNPAAPAEWVRYKYSSNAWTPWVKQVIDALTADIVLHVNSVSGDDSNDGLTDANPKRTIAGAMNAIPHAVAGRNVTIQLAEGQYQNGSILTISGWNGLSLTIGKEPSATTANVQVGALKMESNANCTFYCADFKLTGYIQNFADNKSGSFWANRLLCDGGVIDTRGGYSIISACTFRNISGNAISVTEGYCSITGTAIENTCSYGVKANVNGIVSVSLYNNGTYPPKNEATTPYYIVYSGRIFVGGKTYREVPTVDVLFSGDQFLNQNAYTDITLTASYRNYPAIEIIVSRGTNDTRMATIVNWQSFSSNIWWPISGSGPFYGAIRPQTYAGSETIIRFNGWVGNLASSIHVIGIYGINY